MKIDLISKEGVIREHTVRESDSTRTVCGLTIRHMGTQKPAGNPECLNCKRKSIVRIPE